MGFLGRHREVAQAIQPEHMERASKALSSWERAGSYGESHSVATQLASLGGWNWWLDVAKQAHRTHDARLVGQITCFATQSKAMLGSVPGLGPLPPDVHRALDNLTIEALGAAPSSLVVQDGQAGLIDAETLVGWARMRRQMNSY